LPSSLVLSLYSNSFTPVHRKRVEGKTRFVTALMHALQRAEAF